MKRLPGGFLVGFYGDDFTGSTDAMEVMAFAGLRTVLFTRLPSPADISRFADYRAIGIAGTARSRSPEWMDENLPPVFRALAALRPQILQYKVCSTFDSAPDVGSIGRAIDIGMEITGSRWSPSIVGAPQLRRWQVFGNLFAGVDGTRYRIDRHPTMSRHPVTPMREGDLRVHLRQQTGRTVDSVDLVEIDGPGHQSKVDSALGRGDIVFIDVLDERTQAAAGRLVWENRGDVLFSASSSGLQYALLAHWRRTGRLDTASEALPAAAPVDRLLVLSGSCSPVTAKQIASAEAHGFASLRLDVLKIAKPGEVQRELARIVSEGEAILRDGRSLVIYAAKTVDDTAFAELEAYCNAGDLSFSKAQEQIGAALGSIAATLVEQNDLKRLLVAGGDTAGRVMECLPVSALEAVHPMATGAPVCRVHSDQRAFDKLEVILKGGQAGEADMFLKARDPRTDGTGFKPSRL